MGRGWLPMGLPEGFLFETGQFSPHHLQKSTMWRRRGGSVPIFCFLLAGCDVVCRYTVKRFPPHPHFSPSPPFFTTAHFEIGP